MTEHRCRPYDALSNVERDALDRVRQQLVDMWPLVEEARIADRANDLVALQRLDMLLRPLTTAIGEVMPIIWPTINPSTVTAAGRIGLFAEYLVAAKVEMASRFTAAAQPPTA